MSVSGPNSNVAPEPPVMYAVDLDEDCVAAVITIVMSLNVAVPAVGAAAGVIRTT